LPAEVCRFVTAGRVAIIPLGCCANQCYLALGRDPCPRRSPTRERRIRCEVASCSRPALRVATRNRSGTDNRTYGIFESVGSSEDAVKASSSES
jgi:hypothetical protein